MSGQQALEYIREKPVDLLITDMKMPGMDGLELMEAVRREGKNPVTLVLSGYNEFELVREAFRRGAYDYLLKSALNGESLKAILKKLNQDVFKGNAPEAFSLEQGRIQIPKDGTYGMVLFEVKDFKHQSARFGDDWKEGMAKPMLELVRQIQAVWRDYMNLEVMAGISSPVVYSQMDEALGQDISLLKWSALYGSYGICTYWDMKEFLENMEKEQKRCAILLNALFSGDPIGIEEGRQAIFSNIDRLPVKEAGNRMLHFICLLADRFKEYELTFPGCFQNR